MLPKAALGPDMEKITKTWVVPTTKRGQRLDLSLSQLGFNLPGGPFSLSRSQCKRMILDGKIKVDGQISNPSYRIKAGDIVEITIPPPEPLDMRSEDIPLSIIYEDAALVVIDKPAGLVVHPGAGHKHHTLVNALLHHCPNLSGIGGKQRPGIVHRLDKDTSGLIVVAKTETAHQSLCAQIKQRSVRRAYVALVYGQIAEHDGEVSTLIGRHPFHRKRMSIKPRKGRQAITYWRVKERFNNFTWLELSLKTGRTHQIRVHMAYINHPVVGDRVYGRGRHPSTPSLDLKKAIAALPGQALHAQTLGFSHPLTGEYLEFSTPPPPSIQDILNILRGANP